MPNLPIHAVILAGGRGTRFWPRSRTRSPKQLLNVVGRDTMLQQTASRLKPVFGDARIWVVTNRDQAADVRKQLPRVPRSQILAEPLGRNTAAAIGLAAIHIRHAHRKSGGDAVMAVLPADHYIADPGHYRKILRAALRVAAEPTRMAVLGIPPTFPETGFGYIERMEEGSTSVAATPGVQVFLVARFTEKPAVDLAREYLATGRYFWNAGMFFWRVSTLLENLRRHLPTTHKLLIELARAIGTRKYESTLARIYPKLESISVDYAILEPATREPGEKTVFVLPADIGWSDIGSWDAVYKLLAKSSGETVAAGPHVAFDASGNFLWSPKKFVAAVGIRDLVVVETDDALLICPRERAQDVGKVVKWLEEKKRHDLL
jgi:mannose-1-phosphate guanylyltransferase